MDILWKLFLPFNLLYLVSLAGFFILHNFYYSGLGVPAHFSDLDLFTVTANDGYDPERGVYESGVYAWFL